jgi:hypothetical protein
LLLREHATQISENPNTTLPDLIRSDIAQLVNFEPSRWLDEQLEAGRCVVLLDGLDEVPVSAGRRIVEWVQNQIIQFPKNDFIITSRPYGYQATPLSNATVLQTQPFNETQIERLVHRWYLAIERRSTGESGDEVRRRAADASDDLLRRLRANPAIHELAVNPLLLTMIVNVHRYQGALPGSRAELYYEICQVMLWRRQDAKRLPAALRGVQKEAVLKELAHGMMENHVRDLPRDELLRLLNTILPKVSRTSVPEDFLKDIESNGLMIERENGRCSFVHPTFQEYLTATYIRDQGLALDLAKHIEDPWWREVAVLYAGRGEADSLIEACIDSGSVYALMLAFDLREAAIQVGPLLQAQLDSMLAEAYDVTTESERRRLMIRIIVTRELARTITLESGTSVCASPLSDAVYRLFLSDYPKLACHLVRDRSNLRTRHKASESAIGMWASDALLCIQWLNQHLDSSGSYRLPNQAEVDDPAMGRVLDLNSSSVWLNPDTQSPLPELWVPANDVNPYHLQDSSMRKRIKADLSYFAPISEIHKGGLELVCARRLRLARHLASDFANALARYRHPFGIDSRAADPIADIAMRLRDEEGSIYDLAFLSKSVRSLGRARTFALARHRVRISGRYNRDFYRELDWELISSLGKPVDQEVEAVNHLAKILSECYSDYDLTAGVRAAFQRNDEFIDKLDGNRMASGDRDELVRTGLMLAFALATESFGLVDSIDIDAKLSRHLLARFQASSSAFYPENLTEWAGHGLRAIWRVRGKGNDNERVTWAALEAYIVAVLIGHMVSGEAAADELDFRIPITIRLGALAIAANTELFMQDSGFRELYCNIAAGISVLEERVTGEVRPTEMITFVRV